MINLLRIIDRVVIKYLASNMHVIYGSFMVESTEYNTRSELNLSFVVLHLVVLQAVCHTNPYPTGQVHKRIYPHMCCATQGGDLW